MTGSKEIASCKHSQLLLAYSISQSRWTREGKRAATRQYNEYGEAPHGAADKVNA